MSFKIGNEMTQQGYIWNTIHIYSKNEYLNKS